MRIVRKGEEIHQVDPEEFWIIEPHDVCPDSGCDYIYDRLKIVFHEGRWTVSGNVITVEEENAPDSDQEKKFKEKSEKEIKELLKD